MITRRGFLKSILALGAAPAIVKAESLMKLWTPPQELVLGNKLMPALDLCEGALQQLVLSWHEQHCGIWVRKERLVVLENVVVPKRAAWVQLEAGRAPAKKLH